jgi:thioredoxin 1
MASDKITILTDASFDATIKNATVPVFVDFWAEWCAPCKRLGPAVEALAAEMEGQAIVAKVNVDENPATPGRFNIRGIPTCLVFKNGQLVDQVVGLVSKDELKRMLANHV